MRMLLTGNEAIARGAVEAGVSFASAYPGTPSTEILETLAKETTLVAEWAPNEKVAAEAAIGASIAGARSLCAMKMVGVNVAADPLMCFAYSGVNGGMLLVSGDDPGLHSSQNEQDNRHYARFAKIAMFEPVDSQECKDMVVAAYAVSEQYDTPVLFRVTTRICHSKSIVETGDILPSPRKSYSRNLQKYDLVPAVSKKLHVIVEERLKALAAYSEACPFNRVEYHDRRIGIVASGVAYQYAREVFGDGASYFKIGFSNPLPLAKIRAFAAEVETLYVIEELDPCMEEQIKAAGIPCVGKERLPICGELTPAVIARALLGVEHKRIAYDASGVAPRPPVLCAGCPHRGFFYGLTKYRDVVISGDIGCYGLGGADPLNAKDTCICMGAAAGIGHGLQAVFDKFDDTKRVVAVMGDSTFFHTGMAGLINVIYNRSNTITVVLDNRITGMTGHQDNPGTGFTLQGKPTISLDIETVVRALGFERVRTVNPLHLDAVKEALDWALDLDEPSVIITRWPCVLKRLSAREREEFGDTLSGRCRVEESKCTGCEFCLGVGCPAIEFDRVALKARIDQGQCVGCDVCQQACWAGAISVVEH